MNTIVNNQLLRVVSAVERLRLWLLTQSWFSSHLLPALPRWLRWGLRTVYLAPVDLADRLLGRRDRVMPPRANNCSGAVIDFKGSGKALVKALEEEAGLTSSSRVLDIGCGYGRLAAAMPDYLDANGSYDGLDIVPDAIRWCEANITSPLGNIRFKLANVFNKEYSQNGTVNAAEYRLPFAMMAFQAPAAGEPMRWGINVYRSNPHTGEVSNWSPRMASLAGVVSLFNELVVGAAPDVRRLDVTPYALVQAERGGGTGLRAGVDANIGLSSNAAASAAGSR